MASNNTNEDKHNNLWLENLPVCIKKNLKKRPTSQQWENKKYFVYKTNTIY